MIIACSFYPCILVSKLNPGNNFPVSDLMNSRSNGRACEQIDGFVPRNRKDNDSPDHEVLEKGSNNSYNTRGSIGLGMTSRIPGT